MKEILIAAFALLLFSVPASASLVRYAYTGQVYDSAGLEEWQIAALDYLGHLVRAPIGQTNKVVVDIECGPTGVCTGIRNFSITGAAGSVYLEGATLISGGLLADGGSFRLTFDPFGTVVDWYVEGFEFGYDVGDPRMTTTGETFRWGGGYEHNEWLYCRFTYPGEDYDRTTRLCTNGARAEFIDRVETRPGVWTITPIPLPSTLPIIAAGLGGLGFIGRCKKKAA